MGDFGGPNRHPTGIQVMNSKLIKKPGLALLGLLLGASLLAGSVGTLQARAGEANETAPEKIDKNRESFLEQGIESYDQGDYTQAVLWFQKALELDPENSAIKYEMALAYFSAKKPARSREILLTIPEADRSDQVYQLLGTARLYENKIEAAENTYRQGLQRYPESGPLYLQMGLLGLKQRDLMSSLSWFKKGTLRAPGYSSNYYWLGMIFARSPERVWSIYYGEYFMNLERGGARTLEMSKQLFETYRGSIQVERSPDETEKLTRVYVSFSKRAPTGGVGGILPYENLYELLMVKSALKEKINSPLSLAAFHRLRLSFLENWESGYQDKYSAALYKWWRKLKENEHFEAYNYWLLSQGAPGEFENWLKDNPDKFKNFMIWFKANKIGGGKDPLLDGAPY